VNPDLDGKVLAVDAEGVEADRLEDRYPCSLNRLQTSALAKAKRFLRGPSAEG
jgi:hypothetical protein